MGELNEYISDVKAKLRRYDHSDSLSALERCVVEQNFERGISAHDCACGLIDSRDRAAFGPSCLCA